MSNQLNQRWQALCSDIAKEARRLGATDPFIFACESGLCVLDGPPFEIATGEGRNSAVLFTLRRPPVKTVAFDAGGW